MIPFAVPMTEQLPERARTRVLIIDDDEELNELLTEYLGKLGFAVTTAAHPEQGLRALAADPPDILILDVMLPAMDGFAVCRKVRETTRRAACRS